jgi:hypothetical protein
MTVTHQHDQPNTRQSVRRQKDAQEEPSGANHTNTGHVDTLRFPQSNTPYTDARLFVVCLTPISGTSN